MEHQTSIPLHTRINNAFFAFVSKAKCNTYFFSPLFLCFVCRKGYVWTIPSCHHHHVEFVCLGFHLIVSFFCRFFSQPVSNSVWKASNNLKCFTFFGSLFVTTKHSGQSFKNLSGAFIKVINSLPLTNNINAKNRFQPNINFTLLFNGWKWLDKIADDCGNFVLYGKSRAFSLFNLISLRDFSIRVENTLFDILLLNFISTKRNSGLVTKYLKFCSFALSVVNHNRIQNCRLHFVGSACAQNTQSAFKEFIILTVSMTKNLFILE